MKWIITITILLASLPIGYMLRALTKEELKSGKKYFRAIWVLSLIISLFILIAPLDNIIKKSSIFSLLFIGIVGFISWYER